MHLSRIPFALLTLSLSLCAFGQQRYTSARAWANGYQGGYAETSATGARLEGVREKNGDYARSIAYAEWGRLGVFGQATSDTFEASPYASVWSNTRAYMEDVVTIDAPGLTGQGGSFDLRYRLHASWGATGNDKVTGYDNNGSFKFGVWAQADSIGNQDVGATIGSFYASLSGDTGAGSIDEVFTRRFTFTYGTPFYLGMNMSADMSYGSFTYGALYSGLVDADNTASLRGIPGIYDGSGNLVSGATVTSASGTNYMNPVPEPASLAALGVGLAALQRRRRNRKA